MSLYTIDQELMAAIDNLYSRVDENGELVEVTEKDLEVISQLKAERQVKLENIALYIKNLDADAAAIKEEASKLLARAARTEKKAEGLRGYMLRSMVANNDTELSSPRYAAKISSSESTEILDETLIPAEFIRVIQKDPERKPDKVAIKKAIKAGREVAGAKLVKKQKVNIT